MSQQYLGIELGSTRIKAVLIDDAMSIVAAGSHAWENVLVDGLWSYDLDDVWTGIQAAYAALANDCLQRTGALPQPACIGVSAMMHGYLAFDDAGRLLVPFRTWRNTNTAQASEALTVALGFTIPQRWSVAHLYQAMLDGEPHVTQIAHLTTLAGYVQWRLTGVKVLGVGDASGMFPISSQDGQPGWDTGRLDVAQRLIDATGAPVRLADILPGVVAAGQVAGHLTSEGATLLDPSGALAPGVPFCPPEGDAGTGMVATNAVAARTGNVSAGTSIFAMIVLEGPLALHPEIDMVVTPAGDPVAMVHCNNGASEMDAWGKVFADFADRAGLRLGSGDVFGTVYGAALDGEADGGGLLAYNYLAGEPITGLTQGRPLIVRTPDSRLTLPNLWRTLIMSSFATLSLGMRILTAEGVRVDSMLAHGGVFATKGVAQRLLAAALDTPVSVAVTASEGGAWGMAVLAAYAANTRGLGLAEYLRDVVFRDAGFETVAPNVDDVAGYQAFLEAYEAGLPMQRVAVETSKG